MPKNKRMEEEAGAILTVSYVRPFSMLGNNGVPVRSTTTTTESSCMLLVSFSRISRNQIWRGVAAGCGGIRNAVVPLQMAAPNFQYDDSVPPINATAVAIDKDNKNSNTTVRWAIDHLVIANPYLILIHIRHKSHRRYPLYVRMILIHRDHYITLLALSL